MNARIKTKVIGGGAAAAVLLGGGLAYAAVWHHEQVADAHADGLETGKVMGRRVHTVSGPEPKKECNLTVSADGIALNDTRVTHSSPIRFATANGYCTNEEVDRWVRAVTIETEHRPKVERVQCSSTGACMRALSDK